MDPTLAAQGRWLDQPYVSNPDGSLQVPGVYPQAKPFQFGEPQEQPAGQFFDLPSAFLLNQAGPAQAPAQQDFAKQQGDFSAAGPQAAPENPIAAAAGRPTFTGPSTPPKSPGVVGTDANGNPIKTYRDSHGTEVVHEFDKSGKATGAGVFDGERFGNAADLQRLEAKYLSKQGERETGVKGAPALADILQTLPAFPDDPTGAKRAMYARQVQNDFAKEANASSVAELSHHTAIHGKLLDQAAFNAQREVERTGDESQRSKVFNSAMSSYRDLYPQVFDKAGATSPIAKAAAALSPEQQKQADIQDSNLSNTKAAIKNLFTPAADAKGQPAKLATTPDLARNLADIIRNAGDANHQKAASEHAMKFIANNPEMLDAITQAAAGDYLKTNQDKLASGSLNLKSDVIDPNLPFQLRQSGFGGSMLNRFVGDTIGSDIVGKPLVAVLPNNRNVLVPYGEKHRQYFSNASPTERQAIEGRAPAYKNLLEMFQSLTQGK